MKPGPALILGLVLLGACGVKRPPIPPSELLPKPPTKLEARVRERCVSLVWKAPARPPAGYQVLRRSADDAAPQPLAELAAASRDFTDCAVPPGPRVAYQVKGLDAKGKTGPPSPELTIVFPPPPPPPSDLKLEPGDGFVQLCWTNPPAGAPPLRPVFDPEAQTRRELRVEGPPGFRIYHAVQDKPYAETSRNPDPVSSPCWVDGNLTNGKSYRYQVRSVVKAEGGIEFEGLASAEVAATPADQIAPLPPTELVAAPSAAGVELRWNRNPEPDLQGYYVYRRFKNESRPLRLNAQPLTEPQYLDADPGLRPGREYIYTVTAVDNAPQPNESQPSAPASALALPR